MENSGTILNKTLLQFVVAFGSALGFLWLIIELGQWVFKWELLANTGLLGGIIVLLLSAFLACIAVIISLYKQATMELYPSVPAEPTMEDLPEDQEDRLTFQPRRGRPLSVNLLADLHTAYQQERWEEVIRIGSVLSQPLWVTGRYSLRVEIGRLVESAASYSHKPLDQARALIDDLGWTLSVLGKADEARRNILHGVRLAEEYDDFLIAHKGYRHLCGIALEDGDLDEAEAMLARAEKYGDMVKDDPIRLDISAGLHVAKALVYIKKQNLDSALEQLDIAQRIYRDLNDTDHEISLYHFRGDVLYEMGRIGRSKDAYRRGLSGCRKQSQKDGILRNYMGLAKVAISEGDTIEAHRAYSRAAIVARDLGREDLARELEVSASGLVRT